MRKTWSYKITLKAPVSLIHVSEYTCEQDEKARRDNVYSRFIAKLWSFILAKNSVWKHLGKCFQQWKTHTQKVGQRKQEDWPHLEGRATFAAMIPGTSLVQSSSSINKRIYNYFDAWLKVILTREAECAQFAAERLSKEMHCLFPKPGTMAARLACSKGECASKRKASIPVSDTAANAWKLIYKDLPALNWPKITVLCVKRYHKSIEFL